MLDTIQNRWTNAMSKMGESARSLADRAAAVPASEARVTAVMTAAERSGLMGEKRGRIGGRISPALVRQAKAQTGIATDSDLIAFALASIALEDRFAESFRAVRGTVDPDLDLGF